MSFNFLNVVKSYLTPDLISKASSFLGESESGVSKALAGIVPTVLSGFVSKANSTGSSAGDILNTVTSAYKSGSFNFNNFMGSGTSMLDKGSSLVQSLFGDKLNSLTNSISSFAGIKPSSANTLFSMAGPLVAGELGKYAVDNNLSAGSLSSFLSNQKVHIMDMLPVGLSGIAGFLGLSSVGNSVKSGATEASRYASETIDTAKRSTNWLLWILLLVLAALALWYFLGKGCNKEEVATAPIVTPDTSTVKPVEQVVSAVKGTLDAAGNFIYDIGNVTEIKLADGTTLQVGENSTEAKLFRMLSDASWSIDTIDKTKNWVVLDRVYFETGKSVLTAASMAQTKNIAAILKNFPKASIKLGGYTDNTGDAAVNMKLSDERAKAIGKEMINVGAGAKQVVEAVGYGPEFPVCPANDTPECKGQNRRVDLKVASK